MHAHALVATLALIAWRACAHECPADKVQILHDEARLHKDLLCSYESDYRPVTDHKKGVTVKVRFALKYFSFDALEETFTLHSWIALTWKDEFLTWTPSDYGNVKEIQIESHEIWSPRMSLFNADASVYQPDSFYTTCLLDHEGTVTCVPHVTHTGICRTSLRSWPYDQQNCTLYFGSWMHTGEQLNFTFYKRNPVITDDYQDGPGWKLANVDYKRLPGNYNNNNNTYPMLSYTFTLKRESAGPAAIAVAPAVVVVILTLTSLLLDVRDNTRLLLACFSLFGHYMFLSEIGNNIPKHSFDTPVILLFLRDSMIVTMVAVLATLLLMSMRRRVVPPPVWVASVNRLVSSGPGKYVVFTEFDPSDLEKSNLTEESPSPADDTSRRAEWTQFASLLNSVTFIIAVLVYLILICAYIPRDE